MQLAQDCENAWDARDRDAFTRSVARLTAQAIAHGAGADFRALTLEQLTTRRSEVLAHVADINGAIRAIARTDAPATPAGSATSTSLLPGISLEPGDDEYPD